MLPERDLGNYRVPLQELRRVKDSIRDIGEKPDWLKIAASGFLFLAPAFFLAWYLWPSAFDQLPPSAQIRYAGVGGTLLIAGIACVVVAVAFFIAHRNAGDTEAMGKKHAIDLIENIEDRFMSPGGDL
jgi:hypothetical protein